MRKNLCFSHYTAIIFGLIIFKVNLFAGHGLADYAPGGLIVKFSGQAMSSSDFHIHLEKGIVITGLYTLDSLNSHFSALSFKPFYFELFDPVEDRKQGKDRLFVLQFPANADMEYIASIYSNNPNIEEAYPNYLSYVEETPNDPYYSSQWALPQISAPSAWEEHKGSSSVKIGIIDTGVDLDHPDLQSKLTSSSEQRDEVDINTSSYIARVSIISR